jgi:hypothetical protein
MTRITVATLGSDQTMHDLYDLMSLITHLNPSFHPTGEVVHIKVNLSDVKEALNLLG